MLPAIFDNWFRTTRPYKGRAKGCGAPACPGNGWKRYFEISEKQSERDEVLKLLSGKTRKARKRKRSKARTGTTKKKATGRKRNGKQRANNARTQQKCAPRPPAPAPAPAPQPPPPPPPLLPPNSNHVVQREGNDRTQAAFQSAIAHPGDTNDEGERRDPQVQREGNDVKYPSCHTPFAHPVTRSRARSENVRLTAGFGTCPISTRMKRWHRRQLHGVLAVHAQRIDMQAGLLAVAFDRGNKHHHLLVYSFVVRQRVNRPYHSVFKIEVARPDPNSDNPNDFPRGSYC